jgi:hypothetical protein
MFPDAKMPKGMRIRVFRAAAGLLAAALGAAAGAQEPAPSPSPSPSPAAPAPDESPQPGTRAHEWRRLRETRLEGLRPYEPGFVERQVLAFEKAERPSILDVNFAGFYPRFTGIARGSKVAAGTRFWKPEIGGSRFDVHGSAFFSLASYEYYDLQFGEIPHKKGRFPVRIAQSQDVYQLGDLGPGERRHLILYGSLRYQHFPRVRYFGPGADASADDETNFLDQKAFYELVGGYQLSPRLSFTARAGYLQAFVGRGSDPDEPSTQDVFTDAEAPGLDEQPDFWIFGGQLLWDARDVPGNPRRGVVVGLQANHAQDRGREEYGFTRLAADVRGHVPLGSVQRSLAMRAYVSVDNPDAGARVPFYLQQDLGGSHTLRAFESYRFRDDKVLLLQAEYRFYPAPALELAFFVDAGRVAHRFADLWSDLEADAGFGLRLKSSFATFFRVDVAKGREGWRGVARFSQVF